MTLGMRPTGINVPTDSVSRINILHDLSIWVATFGCAVQVRIPFFFMILGVFVALC